MSMVAVAEATVREHVRNRRRELGLAVGQVFVPQTHPPAQTAEVDWGEAQVQLAGSRVKVHVFVMRSFFRGSVLDGVAGRDPAGVSGRARVGVRLV